MPLPVLVRNNEKGPTVFSDLANNIVIEWQGAGDPNGEDIQQVPASVMDAVPFIKSVRRGIFTIEEADAETQKALEAQAIAYQRRSDSAAAAGAAAIDQQANNDIIMVSCVGPSDRGPGVCGADVPVVEKNKNDAPPLCSRHQSMANQFIPSDGEVDNATGQAVRTWARTIVSATPLPSQQ